MFLLLKFLDFSATELKLVSSCWWLTSVERFVQMEAL